MKINMESDSLSIIRFVQKGQIEQWNSECDMEKTHGNISFSVPGLWLSH